MIFLNVYINLFTKYSIKKLKNDDTWAALWTHRSTTSYLLFCIARFSEILIVEETLI